MQVNYAKDFTRTCELSIVSLRLKFATRSHAQSHITFIAGILTPAITHAAHQTLHQLSHVPMPPRFAIVAQAFPRQNSQLQTQIPVLLHSTLAQTIATKLHTEVMHSCIFNHTRFGTKSPDTAFLKATRKRAPLERSLPLLILQHHLQHLSRPNSPFVLSSRRTSNQRSRAHVCECWLCWEEVSGTCSTDLWVLEGDLRGYSSMSYGYAIALAWLLFFLGRSALMAGNSMGLILGARVESTYFLRSRGYRGA